MIYPEKMATCFRKKTFAGPHFGTLGCGNNGTREHTAVFAVNHLRP